jgi:hypothetical protein
VVTSRAVVAESLEVTRQVTRRAKFKRFGFPPVWLQFVLEESMQLAEPESWPHICPDPGDRPFLALGTGLWALGSGLWHTQQAHGW